VVVDTHAMRLGEVGRYDDVAGYGEIHEGDARWFFHCTAIADGTRTIATRTPVRFRLAPGHLGRYEGVDIRPA
jgi:cold shock protein